jgi:DNA adenine methylase
MEKSFLKWAGGKYKLLPKLIPLLDSFEDKKLKQTFIEPFLGSGTVFLNFNKVNNFILNDSNKDLIHIFSALQGDNDFIEKSSLYFKDLNNDQDFFKKIVVQFNQVATPEQRAQMFIYLNKHCFNGLMRFNKSGYFNTPFGKYKSVAFPREALTTMKAKIAINNVSFLNRSFEVILENSGFGDIVYCDPPYVDIDEQISFKQYGKDVFGLEEQKLLAQLAWEAAQRGAKVVISNHFTDLTKKLYKNCSNYEVIDVKRTISSKGDDRKTVKEILAVYDF